MWICRGDKVVITAISVSALIALITVNWLLLRWSIITCDLSVTRLQKFPRVSLSGTTLSQLVIWKVCPKVCIGSRMAPSDHKWLCYCFTDSKAKICALNMQPDEILKSTILKKKIDRYCDFSCFFSGRGGYICEYVASNNCTKHD